MQAKLIVVGGDVKVAEVKLKLPTVIGRGKGATVLLQHPLVSRQHCEITEQDGQLMVRDLGSLNGTFINNARLTEPTPLPSGDLLSIGDVTFRAEYGESGGAPAAGPQTARLGGMPTSQSRKSSKSAAPPKDQFAFTSAADDEGLAGPQVGSLDDIPGMPPSGDDFDLDMMAALDDVEEVAETPSPKTRDKQPTQPRSADNATLRAPEPPPAKPAPSKPAPAKAVDEAADFLASLGLSDTPEPKSAPPEDDATAFLAALGETPAKPAPPATDDDFLADLGLDAPPAQPAAEEIAFDSAPEAVEPVVEFAAPIDVVEEAPIEEIDVEEIHIEAIDVAEPAAEEVAEIDIMDIEEVAVEEVAVEEVPIEEVTIETPDLPPAAVEEPLAMTAEVADIEVVDTFDLEEPALKTVEPPPAVADEPPVAADEVVALEVVDEFRLEEPSLEPVDLPPAFAEETPVAMEDVVDMEALDALDVEEPALEPVDLPPTIVDEAPFSIEEVDAFEVVDEADVAEPAAKVVELPPALTEETPAAIEEVVEVEALDVFTVEEPAMESPSDSTIPSPDIVISPPSLPAEAASAIAAPPTVDEAVTMETPETVVPAAVSDDDITSFLGELAHEAAPPSASEDAPVEFAASESHETIDEHLDIDSDIAIAEPVDFAATAPPDTAAEEEVIRVDEVAFEPEVAAIDSPEPIEAESPVIEEAPLAPPPPVRLPHAAPRGVLPMAQTVTTPRALPSAQALPAVAIVKPTPGKRAHAAPPPRRGSAPVRSAPPAAVAPPAAPQPSADETPAPSPPSPAAPDADLDAFLKDLG